MFGLACFFGLIGLLAWGTLRRPSVALAAVLCMYGLKQWGQNTSTFLTDHRTIANFSVAAIVLLGLARIKLSGNERSWSISGVGALGIALYCYAAITLVWTPLPAVALQQWALQIPYILVIAVLAPLLFSNADDVQTACRWTIFVGGALSVLALFFGTWGARGLLVAGDLYGMETNPLAIASLGGTVMIMALVALPTSGAVMSKALYALFAIAGLAVILKSGSRGQLLAAAICSLIGWHLASRSKNIGTVFAIAAVGALFSALGWWLWDELGVGSARWSAEQSTEDVTGRFALAGVLLEAALSNPATLLFGIGNSGSFYYIGSYPHVAALEVVAEEGLIGTALYLGILVMGLKSARELATASRINTTANATDSTRYVFAVLTALFIFEWVLTLKQGTLLSSVYFVAYAAILDQLRKRTTMAVPLRPDAAARIPVSQFANLMR